MTDARSMSLRIYGRLLDLYPEDLRRDHGAEMAMVFADDLEAARRAAGWRGVIRVWRCAFSELLRFAIPGCLSSSAIRVPLFSTALFIAATSVEVALVLLSKAEPASHFHANGAAVVIPIFSTPFISLLAVWSCRGGATTLLHLSDTHREEGLQCSKSAN